MFTALVAFVVTLEWRQLETELMRFPDEAYADAMIAYWSFERDIWRFRGNLTPTSPRGGRSHEIARQAEFRRAAWHQLKCAWFYHRRPNGWCLEQSIGYGFGHLRDLQELIGDEAYAAGRMPD